MFELFHPEPLRYRFQALHEHLVRVAGAPQAEGDDMNSLEPTDSGSRGELVGAGASPFKFLPCLLCGIVGIHQCEGPTERGLTVTLESINEVERIVREAALEMKQMGRLVESLKRHMET